MATCARCKTQETQLYINRVLTCIACATGKAVAQAADANGGTSRERTPRDLPEDLKRPG